MITVAGNLRNELLEMKELFRKQCAELPNVPSVRGEPIILNGVTLVLRGHRRMAKGQRKVMFLEWHLNGVRHGENAMFGKLRKLGLLDE